VVVDHGIFSTNKKERSRSAYNALVELGSEQGKPAVDTTD
jgi:hypothetical protein